MSLNEKNLLNMREEISQILTPSLNIKTTETDTLYKMLDDILYAMNESTNITITDRDAKILYVNDKFCHLSKYDKEEIIDQNYSVFTSGIKCEEFFEPMYKKLKKGITWSGEVQNKAKDGTDFWILATVVPFMDANNKPYQFISFKTDITEKKQMEALFKTNFIRTFHNLQNGIFKIKKDKNGVLRYTMAEGKLMEKIGASGDIILYKSTFDVFEPEVAKIKQKYYLEAFEGKRVQYELELNGVLIYVDIEPIEQNGVVTEIVGTVHNFSEFRDVQKQLKANEERYQSLINYSHEYIITLDKKGIIIQMAPKTMQLFGVQGNNFGEMSILEVIEEKERLTITKYFKKALEGKVQLFEYEVKNNEQLKFLQISLVPIIIDNEIEGVYSIGKDITEEKLVQERNAYLAHHDELTHLPNRRWMAQKIAETIETNKPEEQNIAILSLDLDRFKSINDTLGHFVGDELLQQIANRLQKNIYKDKIHIARMGGDEFMILYAAWQTKDEVTLIAETILKSLENPFYVQGFELLITASIGIVFNTLKDANVTTLMKRVDIALYKSKELGRNMYNIYEKSMNRENYQSFIMERDLRKASSNNEFIAYFQPKVDAITGKTVGAEALIRWKHPEHGLIQPGQFIPLAEESGIIISIGKWMKRKVCEQLVEWRNAGIPLIPISVNISSKRFLQDGFAEEIELLLNEFDLQGELLEIEITENSIMRNEQIVQKTLKDLKEMGVKIYIDDFGTGYSSFNYLKTFEIDGVKIDRSFIHNISNKPENASITSAMINMAHHLNLEVIAEGVETKEELDYLLAENCRYIQGFYFGKPCPIEEFEQKFL